MHTSLFLWNQVDYYLGLEAEKFTGNSVSTFTAFIILERQWLGRYVWQPCIVIAAVLEPFFHATQVAPSNGPCVCAGILRITTAVPFL